MRIKKVSKWHHHLPRSKASDLEVFFSTPVICNLSATFKMYLKSVDLTFLHQGFSSSGHYHLSLKLSR